MVLQALLPKEQFLSWQCPGSEEETCDATLSAYLPDIRYQRAVSGRARGAVIVLPRCACGVQTFLKADYTAKELLRLVNPVQNEQGTIWAYVLPLRFVRAIYLHWLLYEQGKAQVAPIIPLAPPEVITHPQLAGIDTETIHALWWGYLTIKRWRPELLSAGSTLLQLE